MTDRVAKYKDLKTYNVLLEHNQKGVSFLTIVILISVILITSIYIIRRYGDVIRIKDFKSFFLQNLKENRNAISVLERELRKSSIMGKGIISCDKFIGFKEDDYSITLSNPSEYLSYAYLVSGEFAVIGQGKNIFVSNVEKYNKGDLILVENLYNFISAGLFQVYSINRKDSSIFLEEITSFPEKFACQKTATSHYMEKIFNDVYTANGIKNTNIKISLVQLVLYQIEEDKKKNRNLIKLIWPIKGAIKRYLFERDIEELSITSKYYRDSAKEVNIDSVSYHAKVLYRVKKRKQRGLTTRTTANYQTYQIRPYKNQFSKKRIAVQQNDTCIMFVNKRDEPLLVNGKCIFDEEDQNCTNLYEISIRTNRASEGYYLKLFFKRGKKTIYCSKLKDSKIDEMFEILTPYNMRGTDFIVMEKEVVERKSTIFVCNIPDLSYKIEGQMEYFNRANSKSVKTSCGELGVLEKGIYTWRQVPSCKTTGEITSGKLRHSDSEYAPPKLRIGSCLWSNNEIYTNCSTRNGELISMKIAPGNIRVIYNDKELLLNDFIVKCKK